MRAAHGGIAAADFSRIRYADLGGLTGDRLISIVDRLARVKFKLRRVEKVAHEATA